MKKHFNMNIQVLVLAAGRSTRMNHSKTKLLHELGEKKILQRVIDNLQKAGLNDITLVVGYQREFVLEHFPDFPFILQEKQLGTGHAVSMAKGLMKKPNTLVIFGDKPLFKPKTLREFVKSHCDSGAKLTASTVFHPEPRNYSEGYGTVVRIKGKIVAFQQTEGTLECDGGLYAFNTEWLWDNIHRLQPHRVRNKEELFIPDMVAIAYGDGERINEYFIKDFREATGINTPLQKEEAEKYLTLL